MEKRCTLDEWVLQDLSAGKLEQLHQWLGLKQYEMKQVIRVYCPGAIQMTVLSLANNKEKWPLENKGYGGYFEAIIEKDVPFLYALQATDEIGHQWCYVDPYQFETTIEDESLYLFGIGKDYEIYRKMGAHFMTVQGIEGVRFLLWAPRAKRVSVIGAFNNYDGRRHVMRHLEKSGVWEIFIPGLKEGESYRYEIKTDQGELLYKADPYANYYEVRPKHDSVIFNDEAYKWQDEKWLCQRAKRKPYEEAVSIYEVHIGSWKRHEDGTFYDYREVAHELVDYVKEMGYTHIELMGIVEHPFDGSWGYQVTGYYAPTSRYGTPNDFKYLVDLCHQHEIGVILDWVPAHFPKDSFALEKFDGHALYEKADARQAYHPDWGTLIFDYGKPQVTLFLIGSALAWLKKYHVDGLRVDAVASMLYLDYGRQNDYVPNKYGGKENLEAIAFLKHLNEVAYQSVEGIMMIAEESTAWPKVTYPTKVDGLGFGFKWNMGWMNDFLNYMKTPPAYRDTVHKKITFSLMYAFSENFIQVLSHDEVVHEKCCMLYKMPGYLPEKFANLKAAYGYMFMHPGKKMLFMGNELAETREWSEERALDWQLLKEPAHQGVWQFIKALNHLYTSEKALWELRSGFENFEWIDCENAAQHVISFVRKGLHSEDDLVVIVNFSEETWEKYRIGVPHSGEYVEVLNSDALLFGGANHINKGVLRAEMTPWHYRPQSIEMTIPKLGISVLKVHRILSPEQLAKIQATEREEEKIEKNSDLCV